MLSSLSTLLPFLLFAFVASITPGPTNILVLSNSARYGFKAALPIVLGACVAAAGIVMLVGSGLGRTLMEVPGLPSAMRWAGVIWLSYPPGRSSAPRPRPSTHRPIPHTDAWACSAPPACNWSTRKPG